MKIFRQGDCVLRESTGPAGLGIHITAKEHVLRYDDAHEIRASRIINTIDEKTFIVVDKDAVGSMSHKHHETIIIPPGTYLLGQIRAHQHE